MSGEGAEAGCGNGSCGGTGATAGNGGNGAVGLGGNETDAGTGPGGAAGLAGMTGEAGEDAGGAGGAGTAGAGAGGSGDAGAGGAVGGNECPTTFPDGLLLYGYDNGALGGALLYPEDPTGAGPACTGPVSTSTVAFEVEEGHNCSGSLSMTVPWTEYLGFAQVTVAMNFASSDWSAYTLLHGWVKVLTPDISVPNTETLAYMNGLQFSAASSLVAGTGSYDLFASTFVPIAEFSDREWHEVTLPLIESPSLNPAAVLNVGVQLQAVATPPPGGPAEPPTTVILIDDIWLE